MRSKFEGLAKLLSFVLCSTIIMSNAMEQRPTGRRSREAIARILAASAVPSMVQASRAELERLARASSTVTRTMAETVQEKIERLKKVASEAAKKMIQTKETEIRLRNAPPGSDSTSGDRDCTELECMISSKTHEAWRRAFNGHWAAKRELDAIMRQLEDVMTDPTRTESKSSKKQEKEDAEYKWRIVERELEEIQAMAIEAENRSPWK